MNGGCRLLAEVLTEVLPEFFPAYTFRLKTASARKVATGEVVPQHVVTEATCQSIDTTKQINADKARGAIKAKTDVLVLDGNGIHEATEFLNLYTGRESLDYPPDSFDFE